MTIAAYLLAAAILWAFLAGVYRALIWPGNQPCEKTVRSYTAGTSLSKLLECGETDYLDLLATRCPPCQERASARLRSLLWFADIPFKGIVRLCWAVSVPLRALYRAGARTGSSKGRP